MTAKVLIIGLDGADWSLLRPLIDSGAMPTLKSFVRSGAQATLESVLQTNSMSAWTTLMTGVNPGKHGVYDFVRRTDTPFRTQLTNSTSIQVPTFFEMASDHGLKSCVIDMPPLYPPIEIDGVVIGGFAPFARYRDLFWPAEIASKVESAVGPLLAEVNLFEYSDKPAEVVANAIDVVVNRLQITALLLKDRDWDIMCTVLTPVDRIQHVFWRDLIEQGPRYELARSFFSALDEQLAILLDQVDLTKTTVLVLSDHGFRSVRRTLDVNQLLSDKGMTKWRWEGPLSVRALRYVSTRVPLPRSAQLALWHRQGRLRRTLLAGSTAYSDMYEGVSINVAGREATGAVAPDMYDEVRGEVAEKLLQAEDDETGAPLVKQVVKREDYYHGACLPEAPCLIIEFCDGYQYGSLLSVNQAVDRPTRTALFESTHLQGAHGLAGVIAAAGPNVSRGKHCSMVRMVDVAPTVLALIGVAPPDGLDGAIANELLVEAPLAERSVASRPTERSQRASSYSEEEEAEVRERLRGLGYIE